MQRFLIKKEKTNYLVIKRHVYKEIQIIFSSPKLKASRNFLILRYPGF